MDEIKNVKKKKIRLMGRYSEASRDGTTSIQAETETPGEVVTTNEYVAFDCGCHFDPSKLFIDEFTGKVVCQDCTVTCAHPKCGRRLFVQVATRIGDYYLCPEHQFSGRLILAMESLSKRKGD
jgi:hypothetical protein